MRYCCIRQHDITDCGAACIATIAKQNGYNISIAKIRELAGTDKIGTNALGLIQAAEQIGFEAKGVKGDKTALLENVPVPCIAHVIVNDSVLHYVVIQKIKKNYIILSDPARGVVKVTLQDFFGEHSVGKSAYKYHWTGVLIFLRNKEQLNNNTVANGTLSKFLRLLYPQKGLLIHIFVASILFTVLGIIGAFYFKELIDVILPESLENTLLVFSVGMIILSIFKVILHAFRAQFLLYLSQKLDVSLLLGYYNHVIDLPIRFFESRKVGEIVSRFIDAGKVRDAISGATLTIMIDSVLALAGGIILFLQNNSLFFIAFFMVILYACIVIIFNKKYSEINIEQMENNSQLTSYMVESLSGIETIKAFSAEKMVKNESEKGFVKLLRSIFNLSFVSNIQSSLKLSVELIGGVLILWIGGIRVIEGTMSLGDLITFNSLLVYFLDPIKNIINLQPQLQTAIVAAKRLGEILELEIEKTDMEDRKILPTCLNGNIKLSDVSFRYGTRKIVIDNVNMEIKKGSKVAFVGESGSGKTTIAKLLLHFYSPSQGSIYINDINLEDINLSALRDRIAYVPQETFLLNDTIYNNLTLGMKEVTSEEVITAAKFADAHEFINELPFRYETKLTENGSNLSGGQRQRLAIARALLKQPDILILDEATSNLDSIAEQSISDTIGQFSNNITIIIIAHRLSTIKHCDKIFVFNKGKLIEAGNHQELIKNNFYYSEMVSRQLL